MSGDPLLGLVRNSDKGLKVIQTEGSPIAPRAGLIFEWAGEGLCRRAEEGHAARRILSKRGKFVMAQINMDHGVPGCFGTSLAPGSNSTPLQY